MTMSRALEATRKEIERWRHRERRLLDALRDVDEERSRLDDELVKVEQQLSYYDSLTRDMNRELGRPGLSSLLSSLRRPQEQFRARHDPRRSAGDANRLARRRNREIDLPT